MRLFVLLWALTGLLASCAAFDVPEPLIEAFEPKGLRVSVPDADGMQSVQFLLSVMLGDGEVLELSEDSEKGEDGRWIYWNPEISLKEEDEIYYKVTVEHDDAFWSKEGGRRIDEVFSMDGKVAEPEERRAVYPGMGRLGLGNVDLFRSRSRGLIAEGKKSSYQSSYSSYQSSDSKPITRSSTSSTTGTYVMKPGGEVEASGYKKSSTYDSTKREGERWEFSESELSPEELEELKRFVGPNFRSLSELTAGQVEEFKRLHGSNFHIPERIRAILPESHSPNSPRTYDESYFSKETSSSVRTQPRIEHPGHPVGFQPHVERAPTRETVYQAHPAPASANRYEEHHRYDHESSSSVSRPIALTVVESADYQKEIPAALPAASSRQSASRSEEYSRGESHRVVSGQEASRQTSRGPSHAPAAERRFIGAGHHRESFEEYAGEDVQAVEKPKYRAEGHYKGSIFRSLITSRANSPQECTTWSETNYDRVTDLNEIQRSISKIVCLASLAEHSLKEELRLLKQENSYMLRKLESLERDMGRYQKNCRCSG